jgi:hypothetical protein
VLLMCVNWTVESVKWRMLIHKHEAISFMQSVKAVLSGIALSMITPNQIGDFAGRILHLEHFSRIKGSLVTVIGHTAQMIMTAVFGLLALTWYASDIHYITSLQSAFAYPLISLLALAAIACFLNIHWLTGLKLSPRFAQYLTVFGSYSKQELGIVLSLSLLRYLVFITQYQLLLFSFGVNVSWWQSVFCIVATLCAQSFAPSFLLVELGLRGASALFFFGLYVNQPAGVLLAAYSLWMINLMLPGIGGLYYITRWHADK